MDQWRGLELFQFCWRRARCCYLHKNPSELWFQGKFWLKSPDLNHHDDDDDSGYCVFMHRSGDVSFDLNFFLNWRSMQNYQIGFWEVTRCSHDIAYICEVRRLLYWSGLKSTICYMMELSWLSWYSQTPRTGYTEPPPTPTPTPGYDARSVSPMFDVVQWSSQ